ncbi:fluoride efflux transporter FluC [Nocardiopsis sediminis]|uniref:Fluoride-specific ion channel FluC n=1 Tax=Nocardiopsis sediminis TaxID=1778267 RepID=A0ABV8FSN9_9ACTN
MDHVPDPLERRAPIDPDVGLPPAPVAPPAPPAPPRVRVDVLAVIAAGGAVGACARYAAAAALPTPPGAFAWSTLLVNVSGCLLIGVLMVLVTGVWPGARLLRPFWGVGVLGGYTSFSTYVADAEAMLAAGAPGPALAYLAATLIGALVAVWAGWSLAERVLWTGTERRRTSGGGAADAEGSSRGAGGAE